MHIWTLGVVPFFCRCNECHENHIHHMKKIAWKHVMMIAIIVFHDIKPNAFLMLCNLKKFKLTYFRNSLKGCIFIYSLNFCWFLDFCHLVWSKLCLTRLQKPIWAQTSLSINHVQTTNQFIQTSSKCLLFFYVYWLSLLK